MAEVRAEPAVLLAAARSALDEADQQGVLDGFEPAPDELHAWVRGTLEHMRTRGAIGTSGSRSSGRRTATGGGSPAAPASRGHARVRHGVQRTGLPACGRRCHDGRRHEGRRGRPRARRVTRGWYAAWTAKCLHVDKPEAAVFARLLMKQLARLDVVGTLLSSSGATTYHLAPRNVAIQAASPDALAAGDLCLECSDCGSTTQGTATVVDQLDDAPCLVARCTGHLRKHPVADNFYRRMYEDSDPARVVAREHTSMLEDEVRLAYETAFKSSTPEPDAPNVLVATPTLEMGIDIGDLSAVMLSSLPRTVASYLQRIGRAGRLTGNALALAFVTARGDQLPRFADPGSVINGAVRPPATYLDAEEILEAASTSLPSRTSSRAVPTPRTRAPPPTRSAAANRAPSSAKSSPCPRARGPLCSTASSVASARSPTP